MKRKGAAVLLALLGLLCLGGCVQEEQESKYHLYYLSEEESRVVAEDYTPQASREMPGFMPSVSARRGRSASSDGSM